MSDDRKYRFGWHPDQVVSSEPDLLGDDVPGVRQRRQSERDAEVRTRSMVHLHEATESAIRVTPVIGLFDDLLEALRFRRDHAVSELVAELDGALADAINTNARVGELEHCDSPAFRSVDIASLIECVRDSKKLAAELTVKGVKRSLRRLDEAFDLIHMAQRRSDSR